MKLLRSIILRVHLSRFQWYRRLHGGRWERHWIDVCNSYIWLSMHPDRCWPKYRQPCSWGIPVIEDYPAHKDAA